MNKVVAILIYLFLFTLVYVGGSVLFYGCHFDPPGYNPDEVVDAGNGVVYYPLPVTPLLPVDNSELTELDGEIVDSEDNSNKGNKCRPGNSPDHSASHNSRHCRDQ